MASHCLIVKCGAPSTYPNSALTPPRLECAALQTNPEDASMDVVFVLIIVALYAVTHWVTWAISRLGGLE